MAMRDGFRLDDRATFATQRLRGGCQLRSTRSGGRALAITLAALVVVRCGVLDGERDPAQAFPPGAHVVVHRSEAAPFVDRLAREGRTHISQIARRAAELPPCTWLVGTSDRDDLALALERLACVESLPTAFASEIGSAHVLVVWPGSGVRSTATGRFQESGDLHLDIAPTADFPWWLIPDGAPKRAFLDDAEAVIMARWRAPRFEVDVESADMASVSPRLAQALADATLDGAYELALYRPTTTLASLSLVLALSTQSEVAARAGLTRIVDALVERYALVRETVRMGDDEAVCLTNLEALPGLSPCGVVKQGFVVVAWDRATLARALTAHEAKPPPPPSTSILRLDFDEIDAIDLALARTRAERDPTIDDDVPPPSPYGEIRVVSLADQGRATVRVIVDLRDERSRVNGGSP